VAVFDITEPAKARYVDMIVTDGERAPEGLAAYQYRGDYYLAIANEVSIPRLFTHWSVRVGFKALRRT